MKKRICLYHLLILLLFIPAILQSQVSINNDGSDADESAMLDVKSNSLGFLPPRMSEAERDNIPSPAAGLIIFNTDRNCLDFYSGSEWRSVYGLSSSHNGSSPENAGTNCLQILNDFPASESGIYWIDADGAGGQDAVLSYCDMETDGGGWTMVASNSMSDLTFPTDGTAYVLTTPGYSGNPGLNTDYIIGPQMSYLSFSSALIYIVYDGGSSTAAIKDNANTYPWVSPTEYSYTVLYNTGEAIYNNAKYFVLGCEEMDVGNDANSRQNTIGAGVAFSSSGDPSEGQYVGHPNNTGSFEGLRTISAYRDATIYCTFVR